MITALYAALLAFLLIALSAYVIQARRKTGLKEDTGERELQKRIGAHANFTQYTPHFLILLGALESLGFPHYGLHFLGALFFAGRLTHAYGLLFAEDVEGGKLRSGHYRVRGMAGTFIAMGSAAAFLLLRIIHALLLGP